MTGKRRALVAPQNTFVEHLHRRATAHHYSFALANARLMDCPIVYISDDFCKTTGYSKGEILNKGYLLSFLHGELTDPVAIHRIQTARELELTEQVEILLYKKNRSTMWLLLEIAPVRDEAGTTIMFALAFKDISSTKQPEDESGRLSKFVRLARHITKSRNSLMVASRSDMQKQTSFVNQVQSSILHNLPIYKQEPPKTPPSIILHYGNFKSYWNWVILMLTFYTSVMVPANVAFHNKTLDSLEFVILDGFIDAVFLLDIFLNFRTTFVGHSKEVVSDPKQIRRKYLRSWFIIDVLSCLPYDALQLVIIEEASSALSALKVLRLLRLGRVVRRLDQYLEYGAAVLVLLICLFLLIAHWMACIWYTLGLSEQDTVYGWYRTLSNHMFRNQSGAQNVSKSMAYLTSMYYTLSCMTSVGFGNVSANTEMEKLFTILLMVLGALLFATIFGNITTIFQQLYSATSKYHDVLNSVSDFMRIYDVPADLQNRVLDYIVSTWFMTKGVDTNKVLSHCPKDMKADICVHLNRAVFDEHSAFRLASEGCLRALAMHFTMNHTAPGDTVVRQGDSVDCLFFVTSGSVEVSQDDQIVAILTKGDAFGDCFWLYPTLGQSQVTVKTLTYADLHVIKKDKLMEVLNFYRAFAQSFARNLTLTYNLREVVTFRKQHENLRELDKKQCDKTVDQLPPSHPVKRLMQRFRRLSDDRLNPAALRLTGDNTNGHKSGSGSGSGGAETRVPMPDTAGNPTTTNRKAHSRWHPQHLSRLHKHGTIDEDNDADALADADCNLGNLSDEEDEDEDVCAPRFERGIDGDLLMTMRQLVNSVNELRHDTTKQLLEVDRRVSRLEQNLEYVRDTLAVACSHSLNLAPGERSNAAAAADAAIIVANANSSTNASARTSTSTSAKANEAKPVSVHADRNNRVSLRNAKQSSAFWTKTIVEDEGSQKSQSQSQSKRNSNSYDEAADYADGITTDTREVLLRADGDEAGF